MIKPDFKETQLDLDTIHEIVVDTELPVNKVGVSSIGNTFVHCPTIEITDKLQEQFSDMPGQTVHSLKNKQPSISIVGITENFTKDTLVERIRIENKYVKELMNDGHTFKILFMKPPRADTCITKW